MSNVPDTLRYSSEHEYIKQMDDPSVVEIGITDYAQGELGDIVFVSLPAVGDTFDEADALGTIEAVKAVSELYSPVSGEVVEVNEALDGDPAIINRDVYGDGWMVRMKISDTDQLDALMDADGYKKHIGEA